MSSFPAWEGALLRDTALGFKALSRMSSFPAASRSGGWPPRRSSFKALSRMSSFPAHIRARADPHDMQRFKALSRMSSFPAHDSQQVPAGSRGFQSAVAHELISSTPEAQASAELAERFKALSRMSSFPAIGLIDHAISRCVGFKALSRMSSFPAICLATRPAGPPGFQSAVAHELISSEIGCRLEGGQQIVSKRCRA